MPMFTSRPHQVGRLFPALVLCLTGCAWHGPAPILTSKGVTDSTSTSGVANRFNATATQSFANPDDSAAAAAMLENGFALVHANCSEFFLAAGKSQRWVLAGRDTVGALGTLASGIVALEGTNSKDAGYIALATGAAFSGLDIYTKNFLFAAENISSVRELTVKALAAHQREVKQRHPNTYALASSALFDHQDICAPMSIAALARQAIANGTVRAAPDPQRSFDPVSDLQDQQALGALGALLLPNPTASLSRDEAGALWWALKLSTNAAERALIAGRLERLKPPQPLDATGQVVSAFPKDQALKLLESLSARTRAEFTAAIEANKKFATEQESKKNDPGAKLVPLPNPGPDFTPRSNGDVKGIRLIVE